MKRGESGDPGCLILRFLSLVTVLLLVPLATPRLWAQEYPWYVPDSPWYVPGAPNGSDSPVDSHCPDEPFGTDYWIISSQRCPQSGVPCCCGCRFDYYYYGNGPCGQRLDRASFHRWLKPGVPVCIVVHGSYLTEETVRSDSRRVYRWIRSAAPDRRLQVVFYHWPSESVVPLLPHLDVAILGRRSEFNGFYLAQLVADVPQECPVSLLGHSHGARTVSAGLHLLAGGCVRGYRFRSGGIADRRLRAVFIAAAMDHHWLDPGERFERAVWPVECLLNLRNDDDFALSLYPLRRPFSSRALGRAGFQRQDLRRLGWFVSKVAQLEVAPRVGMGHGWAHYYNHPEIAAFLAPDLYMMAEDP